ncbi:hypothetical protein MBRA_03759 [Methylobacterium brachiatum]|nr:hypothetical protein MBRA_03759 [Methylobacterium brachiatum]
MVVQMAFTAYPNRTGPICVEQAEQLFASVAVQKLWVDMSLNMRTVALMMATALHAMALFEQNAGAVSAKFSPQAVIDLGRAGAQMSGDEHRRQTVRVRRF